MKAGVIAAVDEELNKIESFEENIPLPDHELYDSIKKCVQIRETIELADNRIAQIGRAAVDEISTNEKAKIEQGEIRVSEKPEKITKYTEFLLVEGTFVAVSSGSGRFVFDLISKHTGSEITPVEFDIKGFIEDKESADPWKVGFENRTGNAENGVVHGEELLRDRDMGSVLNNATKNQIGLEYSSNGYLLKVFVVKSGYVEVYQPSNYDSREFINFIESDLLQHINKDN